MQLAHQIRRLRRDQIPKTGAAFVDSFRGAT